MGCSSSSFLGPNSLTDFEAIVLASNDKEVTIKSIAITSTITVAMNHCP